MRELYELKELLCKELKEYGEKGELTAGTLDVVDKLAHTVKNIDKIIEAYEDQEGYSSRSYSDGMGGSYRGYAREGRGYSREGGYSNARGRMNVQRDSRGRYSGADGDVEDIKRDMQRLMDKVEKM